MVMEIKRTKLLCTLLFFVVKTLCSQAAYTSVYLNVSLLPDEKYDLQLQCTAEWLPKTMSVNYVDSIEFHNNRNPHHIRSTSCTMHGKLDSHHCEEMLRVGFGLNTWSNCTASATALIVTVKLTEVTEADLASWTCIAHFTDPLTGLEEQGRSSSSAVYDKAAITNFKEDGPLLLEQPIVVPVRVTESGLLVVGCSLPKLNSTLTVGGSNETGVPLKKVRFDFDGVAYEGDLFERLRSKEVPQCADPEVDGDQSVHCFGHPLSNDDQACKGHSFTLLAESTERNITSHFKPQDTTPFFGFPSHGSSGYQVRLNSHLVVENTPRAVACHPVAGNKGSVCLTSDTLRTMFRTLMELAGNYTQLLVHPVTDHRLYCDNGRLLVVLSPECLGSPAVCDGDGGFKSVVKSDDLNITEDFFERGCVGSHYYCFYNPRLRGRDVNLVVVSKQETIDGALEVRTSADVAHGCSRAHRVRRAGEIYESYDTALTTYIQENSPSLLHTTVRNVPLLTCPCIQAPKTCPSTFPIVATVAVNPETTHGAVSCSLFGKKSAVVQMPHLLAMLACTVSGSELHHFLPPPTPKLKDSAVARHALLFCTTPADVCSRMRDQTKFTVILVPYNWMGSTTLETHTGNGIVVDPVLFATRYDTVQCQWQNSVKGSPVSVMSLSKTFKHHCDIQDTYEVDIWRSSNNTVQCIVSRPHITASCPEIETLALLGHSCTKDKCAKWKGGDGLSITSASEDLSQKEEIFTCSARLESTGGHVFPPLRITKTVGELNSHTPCDFNNLRPVMVHHTSKRGDAYLSCTYPLSAGDVRECIHGVGMATIEYVAKKIGRKSGRIIVPMREESEVAWTVVTYTLKENNRAMVSTDGNFREHVRARGYVLPKRRVLSAKISTDYFSSVTDNGRHGVAVQARCSFVYDTQTRWSSTVTLTGAVVRAYENAKLHQVFTKLRKFSRPVSVKPSSETTYNEDTNEYHGLMLVTSVIGVFMVVVSVTVTVAIAIAPKYRTS